MRCSLFPALLFLPLLLASASTPSAETHLFADAYGRTIVGVIIDATDAQVKIRRDDAQIVTVEIAKLAEVDAAYVAQWRRDHVKYVLKIETTTFHATVGSNRSGDPGVVDQGMVAGYEIKISNNAGNSAKDLRVEYNVFGAQYDYEEIVLSLPSGNGPGQFGQAGHTVLRTRQKITPTDVRLKGTYTLDLAGFKTSAATRTEPLRYRKHATLSSTANNYETGELRGIWVRVMAGSKIVAEFLSDENIRGLGWQDIASAGTGGSG